MNSPRRADFSRTWAVVPIRGLETAKTRLGGDLDPEERRSLVTELLRRTLVATRDASTIAGTVVVTMDPAAAAIANRHRAIGLLERVPGGLNAAIEAARSVAIARGASAVLVLPADLPAVSAAALDELIETAREAATAREQVSATNGAAANGLVLVVPDRHGAGTNALLVSPPDAVAPRFGDSSRAAHREAARDAGMRYLELDGPLSLDVDTPADLLVAEAALGGPLDA
ncbi:MAG TPA: 2-phospho-L-lactate guanylyltransferase [Candidatus Eisenbacteria bacterium]|nr:2-phospho-L-lactate guanylyltransferase [Candidatus Eisenbacteria bacterium]